MPQHDFKLIIRLLIVYSLGLMGLSLLLGSNTTYLSAIIDFYHLSSSVDSKTEYIIAGVVLLCIALQVATVDTFKRSCFTMFCMIAIALIPLITLTSESRWIASLGGFPAIGSGQGIIKYYALIPLAIYVYCEHRASLKNHALLNFSSVALVLFWIGGMKFTELEAKGIEPLVNTSPFMSWMYEVFSVQTASNLIGVYDIAAAILLGIGIYMESRQMMRIGMVTTGAVFVMTQTFLVTAEGGFSADNVIDSLGFFVIKDIWFIANLVVIYRFYLSVEWQTPSAQVNSPQQSPPQTTQ